MSFTLVFLAVVASFTQPATADKYNDYQIAGNKAALAGRFEAAIPLWRKAAALDTFEPVKKCRGKSQLAQIRAAQDTIAALRAGRITRAQAVEFDEHRNTALWIHDPCNLP